MGERNAFYGGSAMQYGGLPNSAMSGSGRFLLVDDPGTKSLNYRKLELLSSLSCVESSEKGHPQNGAFVEELGFKVDVLQNR
eukprot:UN03849